MLLVHIVVALLGGVADVHLIRVRRGHIPAEASVRGAGWRWEITTAVNGAVSWTFICLVRLKLKAIKHIFIFFIVFPINLKMDLQSS